MDHIYSLLVLLGLAACALAYDYTDETSTDLEKRGDGYNADCKTCCFARIGTSCCIRCKLGLNPKPFYGAKRSASPQITSSEEPDFSSFVKRGWNWGSAMSCTCCQNRGLFECCDDCHKSYSHYYKRSSGDESQEQKMEKRMFGGPVGYYRSENYGPCRGCFITGSSFLCNRCKAYYKK